jgi:hypothetical protein
MPRSRTPSRPEKRFEQRVAELFEFAPRPDLRLTGAAACNDLKVGELHLEGDSAAAHTGALAISPDFAGDFSKRIPRGFVGEKIGGKCVLGANRFARPVSAHRAFVDAARGPVIIRARLPEMVLQETLCLALKIGPVSIPSRAIFLAVAGPMP